MGSELKMKASGGISIRWKQLSESLRATPRLKNCWIGRRQRLLVGGATRGGKRYFQSRLEVLLQSNLHLSCCLLTIRRPHPHTSRRVQRIITEVSLLAIMQVWIRSLFDMDTPHRLRTNRESILSIKSL